MSRGLALAALAVVALTAALDSYSGVAARLRAGAPVTGLIWTRLTGQGRVVPPSVYIAIYAPKAARLEIISAPASAQLGPGTDKNDAQTLADVYDRAYAASGDVRAAARAMSDAALAVLSNDSAWPAQARAPDFRLELTLSAWTGPLDLPEIKEHIRALASHPTFWLRTAARLSALSRSEAAGLFRSQPSQGHMGSPGAPGLSRYDAFLLAWTLHRLDASRIRLSRLPPPSLTGKLLERALGGAEASAPSEPTAEILNASSSQGIAMRATKILRSGGVDVLHFGNGPGAQDTTRFIDRIGSWAAAEAARGALGCAQAGIVTEIEAVPRAAVTVILGEDFVRCGRLGPEETPAR